MNNKRKALITTLILLLLNTINAQICTPDPNVTSPGYYPKVLENVYIDSNHQQVLTVMAPKDTTVVVQGQKVKANITNIKILEVMGLPTGFTWKCNDKDNLFYPNISGCVNLKGKATKSQEGEYPLKIVIKANAIVIGYPISQNDTIEAFALVVKQKSTAITTVKKGTFYYNKDYRTIVFKNKDANRTIQIIDMKGAAVFNEVVKNKTIKLPSLEAGVYSAIVREKENTSFVKFIVK